MKLSTEQIVSISRALADPRRFAMLQQIAAADSVSCQSLREQREISPATISHHLKELQEAGLLEMEREGRCAHLSLRRDTWEAYLEHLSRL